MAGGVAHRAEAALRQSRNRSLGARRNRAQVGVNPRDQLVDVKRLPLLRPVGPVGAPAATAVVECDVRHHGDELTVADDALRVPLERPVRCRATGPVQQVEDRVATMRLRVVSRWQQDVDVRRPRERFRGDDDGDEARVDLLDGDDVQPGRGAQRPHGRRVSWRGERRDCDERGAGGGSGDQTLDAHAAAFAAARPSPAVNPVLTPGGRARW